MSDDHIAFNTDGKKLPYSPDEVKEVAMDILKRGELILVVSKIDGKLGVNVLGPPSNETLEILEDVTDAYRRAIGR